MEREKAFLFASQEGRHLYQIDSALRRLYKDPAVFGNCELCGESIKWERLEALPYATLCIACKEREENGRGV
jgi:RNA polymerase-binding transcription factor DksA